MSVNYMFTVKRNADGKKLGSFYYDMIKTLDEIDIESFKVDLEKIYRSSSMPVKLTCEDIASDIDKIRSMITVKQSKMFEKKLLVPHAASIEVKDDLEADIYAVEEEISHLIDAAEALAGLQNVVRVIVEDMVKDTGNDDDEHSIAYTYNAEGLPKSPEGYEPHIWTDSVYIEAEAH